MHFVCKDCIKIFYLNNIKCHICRSYIKYLYIFKNNNIIYDIAIHYFEITNHILIWYNLFDDLYYSILIKIIYKFRKKDKKNIFYDIFENELKKNIMVFIIECAHIYKKKLILINKQTNFIFWKFLKNFYRVNLYKDDKYIVYLLPNNNKNNDYNLYIDYI